MRRDCSERARSFRRAGACGAALVLFAAAAAATIFAEAGATDATSDAPGDRAKAPPPHRVALSETAGVSLTLLDVEVKDANGHPIRGLKKEDFAVQLGASEWPIYSVDDFCPCEEQGEGAGTETERSKKPPGGSGAARGAGTSDANTGSPQTGRNPPGKAQGTQIAAPTPNDPDGMVRFAIYFDFSQLGLTGRAKSLAEAKRWLHDVKRPADSVMIAGYSTAGGLRELTPFTTDSEALLAAVEKAREDPTLQDPFPTVIDKRQRECNLETEYCLKNPPCEVPTQTCVQFAREEFSQGRRSFKTLEFFFQRLEQVPGRKVLLLFQENGTIFPARLYPFVTDFHSGDHERELDQVGADAVTSRTSVFAAYPGDNLGGSALSELAVNLGSNLADYTGGAYNRDLAGLSRLTSQAHEACPCFYRIGLLPRENQSNRIYRASVEVRGKELPSRWRVRFLDDVDRWLRAATRVLFSPEKATDIGLSAAIVPVKASDGRCDLSVQLAFDIAALESILGAGGDESSWEAGGLLVASDGSGKKEMLAVSSLRRKGEGRSASAILHELTLRALKPGSYKLAAFVRDKTAGVFGGAQSTLDLPPSTEPGVAGPLLLHTRRHLTLPLPILKKGRPEPAHVSEAGDGVVPGRPGAAVQGEVVDMFTWFCPKTEAAAGTRPRSYLSRDGKPILRIDGSEVESAGECERVHDRIDTSPLDAGVYTYTVALSEGIAATNRKSPMAKKHQEGKLSFEIVEASSRKPSAETPPSTDSNP